MHPCVIVCCFVQLEASDLEPYLTNVHNKALKHSLQSGVGFLHENMSAAEQEIVNRLFNNGAIQVDSSMLLCCWYISKASQVSAREGVCGITPALLCISDYLMPQDASAE